MAKEMDSHCSDILSNLIDNSLDCLKIVFNWGQESCYSSDEWQKLKQIQDNEGRQKKLDTHIPLISLYVAAASLACTLAMAADVIHCFRRKKLWFPSKFFTVSAAFLTILDVAMKLPMDLISAMDGDVDQGAKLISNVFKTTVMGNFLTLFASMDDKAIFMNITALGILVITIIVNIFVQLHTSLLYLKPTLEISVTIFMFILFVTLCFSALTIPVTKRSLELEYDELYKKISNEELEEIGKLTVQNLKVVVEKYWVMAETSDPQFVMARSVICIASGAISLLITTLTLIVVAITIKFPEYSYYSLPLQHTSSYGWSIPLIVVIQIIEVIVGTVAPTFRCFIANSFKCWTKAVF